jgi:hypothetical protein
MCCKLLKVFCLLDKLVVNLQKHDVILVVVDTLTKRKHFLPIKNTYKAPYMAKISTTLLFIQV